MKNLEPIKPMSVRDMLFCEIPEGDFKVFMEFARQNILIDSPVKGFGESWLKSFTALLAVARGDVIPVENRGEYVRKDKAKEMLKKEMFDRYSNEFKDGYNQAINKAIDCIDALGGGKKT